jgi:hypothetical protein
MIRWQSELLGEQNLIINTAIEFSSPLPPIPLAKTERDAWFWLQLHTQRFSMQIFNTSATTFWSPKNADNHCVCYDAAIETKEDLDIDCVRKAHL